MLKQQILIMNNGKNIVVSLYKAEYFGVPFENNWNLSKKYGEIIEKNTNLWDRFNFKQNQ
jgi:hypothetical protein